MEVNIKINYFRYGIDVAPAWFINIINSCNYIYETMINGECFLAIDNKININYIFKCGDYIIRDEFNNVWGLPASAFEERFLNKSN
jgi:hypothetical protein